MLKCSKCMVWYNWCCQWRHHPLLNTLEMWGLHWQGDFFWTYWGWRNPGIKQHGQTVTPFSEIAENLETLFLLCTSSVVCYTVTALHFRSQLCFHPQAQTCVVDPLDRATLRYCAVSKESTCLGLHMRLEIQLALT